MRASTEGGLAGALLAGALLAGAPARAGDVSWYAIPNAGFDTDELFGFGARAEVNVLEEGYAPYKAAYMVQSYVTVTGYQLHRFRFDRTGLGADGDLRLTAHVSWRQWNNDGYWGIGNFAPRERAFVGSFDREDPASKRYAYVLKQPFAQLTLRRDLGDAWAVFGALNPKWSAVEAYPGSLLEAQQPYGMDGGLSAQIFAGILYDTRAPEPAPRSGIFAELSQRFAPPVPMSAGTFGGTFASLRAFRAAGERVVFAGRIMGEWLYGEVPFFEMVHWGGSTPIPGFGGYLTLRGVTFGRWHAPGKAVANGEIRIDAIAHSLAGDAMVWQVVPFLDLGTVFGAGDAATSPPPAVPVHPAAGIGIHPVYAEQFVGRLDLGVGLDPIEEPDGAITWAPNLGFYLVFDQTF